MAKGFNIMAKGFNFEEKAKELSNKLDRVVCLQEIYNKVYENMQWNTMNYHPADETHAESYYTPYDSDTAGDYGSHKQYEQSVYQEVLDKIMEMANK